MESREGGKPSRFRIMRLEERIAPTANHNPGQNNTNQPGDQPGSGGGNNNPGENNTNNPGNETP
jgi:hypothetical protein